MGVVDAINEDSVVIGTARLRGECKLPKSELDSFNCVKVSLKSRLVVLEKYKV